jgi:cell division septum initiation protein DivIVA
VAESENTRAAELSELLEQRSLPTAVRGYDRAATDRLLAQLDEGLKAVLRQQAATQSRMSDLERRLAEGQDREEAVAEALVLATQIRGESEREAKEIRERYESEAEGIKDEAQRRAESVLREADSRAQSIVGEAEAKAHAVIGEAEANAHAFDQQIRDAQELAQRIRAHLATFLRSMLDEVDRRNEESASIVGDLLAQAGERTRTQRDSNGAVPDPLHAGTRDMAEFGNGAAEPPPLGA